MNAHVEAETIVEQRDGVCRITLNRPEIANALLPAQRDLLIDLFEAASGDRSIRAIVLGATGKHFCSGADLTGGGMPDDPVVGDIGRVLRRGAQRLIASILDCDKPVVAEVHGAAAGIGAHMVLACDLVVAADDARLIEVFVKRALIPDGGGIYLLSRLLGPLRTKQLCLLGDRIPADRALQMGLFTEVVAAAALRPRTDELAAELAAGPTTTMAFIKSLANRALDSDRAQCFAEEALAQELNLATEDFAEGAAAFAAKRAPTFKGF